MAAMGGSCVGDASDLAAGAVRSLLQRTAPPTSLQGWKAYVTIAVLVIGLVLLYMDLWRTELVMIGMVVTLLWAQVLDLPEALEGFSSSSILTVMVLLGMAEGISQTGALDSFFQRVLGRPSTPTAAIIRMALPVCFWSSFLNNTPIVALMIPLLVTWSRAIRIPLGKLMIPLSYVSELGGVCTLIGTSTNLVIKEKYDQAVAADPSLPTLSIFSQSRFGVPIALMGVVYIALFGHMLLPGSTSPADQKRKRNEDEEPLQVGMFVPSASPAVGKTVEELAISDHFDLQLTHVNRDGRTLPASAGGLFVINMYDELYVTGDMSQVDALAAQLMLTIVTDEYDVDPFTPKKSVNAPELQSPLLDSNKGMTSSDPGTFTQPPPAARKCAAVSSDVSTVQEMIRLVHVTIKAGAPIAGGSIKDAAFRSRFHAAVVDIRRSLRRVPGALSAVILAPGDELMLDAGNAFSPGNADVEANFEDVRPVKAPAKQFMLALEVIEGSGLVGKTLQGAGLRGMGNAYVSLIQRGAEKLHAVSPAVELQAGDVLWIAGASEAIHPLRNKKGLRPYGPQNTNVATVHKKLIQAALSSHSPLLGQTVSSIDFPALNVALLAVHRSGSRLVSGFGDVRLQTGDVLLLEGSNDFVREHKDDEGFALLSVLDNSSPVHWNRSILALSLLLALIAAQVGQNLFMEKQWVSFLTLSLTVVALMLVTRCLSPEQLHRALKWDLYLTVAAAIGLSNAVSNTGVAAVIAKGLVSVGNAMGGDVWIQAGLYLATALLSNIIANFAAAALLFPIVLQISKQQGIDLQLLTFLLMFGASSAFMTPYGYQTNLMVQDVGGYKPMDYLKFGGPMQLWQMVVTVAIMSVPDLWWMSWIVVAAICLAVFVPALAGDTKTYRTLKRYALGFRTREEGVELESKMPSASRSAV